MASKPRTYICRIESRGLMSTDLNALPRPTTPARYSSVSGGTAGGRLDWLANRGTISISSTSVYTEFTNLVATGSGLRSLLRWLVAAADPNSMSTASSCFAWEITTPRDLSASPAPTSCATKRPVRCSISPAAVTANTVGGLSLVGNVTVQDVAAGGSVQFDGDVVASANAALLTAAGAGSVPRWSWPAPATFRISRPPTARR